MFQNLLEFFKKLFPWVKPKITNSEQITNTQYATKYEDINEINITALVAGKLANIVICDGEIEVIGDNARAEFLNGTLKTCTKNLRDIICRELGTGGVILKPFIYNNKIYTNILGQDRFIEVEKKGDLITKAGFIAETFTKDNKIYTRFEYHMLDESGIYTIMQKGTIDGTEVILKAVEEWAELEPFIKITGVEQMLFAFIKCPVDNRKSFSTTYGVPITYGQEKLVSEIVDLINEMQKEFKNKRTFIGVDSLLFNGNNNLPEDGVYQKFQTDREDFWEIFSPDIRQQSYIDGINYKMEFLEKAIGVSKGVLTNLETNNATATEIKRSTFDTFALVASIRQGIEIAINQLVYAYDIVANASNLAPHGDYKNSI